MPIPLLIVGIVAAAVAAVALRDDDKPSSSGRSSDDAERRRKEAAEKERKARARAQKQEAAREDFHKEGKALGKILAQALPSDLVKTSSHNAFTLNFDLKKHNLQFDMEEASQRDANLQAAIDGLETILTKRAPHQQIMDNLAIFSELYKPIFQCEATLRRKKLEVIRINNAIEELKKIKTRLKKFEREAVSTQV